MFKKIFNSIKGIFNKSNEKENKNNVSEETLRYERRRYNYIKDKIDAQIKNKEKYVTNIAMDSYKKEKEIVDKHNGECPLCKSKNVVNKIHRTQGELNGSYSSYQSGGLFGHTLSYGNIKGSIDTNEVKHCNDCGNEWKPIGEPSMRIWQSEMFNLQGIHLINNIIDIVKTIYDKTSKYEKYDSIEEKKEALFNEVNYAPINEGA